MDDNLLTPSSNVEPKRKKSPSQEFISPVLGNRVRLLSAGETCSSCNRVYQRKDPVEIDLQQISPICSTLGLDKTDLEHQKLLVTPIALWNEQQISQFLAVLQSKSLSQQQIPQTTPQTKAILTQPHPKTVEETIIPDSGNTTITTTTNTSISTIIF
jgi:hypothetical protein